PRLISLSPWLALAALVVLLLEVVERRMGVLSQVQRFSWNREKAPKTARRRWFARRPVTLPLPTSKVIPMETPPAVQPPRPLPNAEEKADMLDALRQARQRLRGRTE